MKYGDKLYVITRRDLTTGYQAVQSIHAMTEFTHDHPEIEMEWYGNSNHLALLTVDNERQLLNLYDDARRLGLKVSMFTEPDLEDQVTAIALEPGEQSKKLCSCLPLMR